MGVNASDCMCRKKKERYITAVKLDRDESSEYSRKTIHSHQNENSCNTPVSHIQIMTNSPSMSSISKTREQSMHEKLFGKRQKAELSEKTALIDHKNEMMDITLSVNNRPKSSQKMMKPPHLKKMSRIDTTNWSPVKDEYDRTEEVTNMPGLLSKPYFDETPF